MGDWRCPRIMGRFGYTVRYASDGTWRGLELARRNTRALTPSWRPDRPPWELVVRDLTPNNKHIGDHHDNVSRQVGIRA